MRRDAAGAPRDETPVVIRARNRTNTNYIVDAIHRRATGETVGGVSYEVHSEKGFKQE